MIITAESTMNADGTVTIDIPGTQEAEAQKPEVPKPDKFNLGFLKKERLRTGFGEDISGAKNLDEVLQMSGTDWDVVSTQMWYMTPSGALRPAPGQKVNVRTADEQFLGTTSERYSICQNREGFEFMDPLIQSGEIVPVRGGSFYGGKKVWLEMKLPETRTILGDKFTPYIIFTNSHDGSGSVRVAVTPVRIICSNALTMALGRALRSWSIIHTGRMHEKLMQAQDTMANTALYLAEMEHFCEDLRRKELTNNDVISLIDTLLPYSKKESEINKRNVDEQRSRLNAVYFQKEDLKELGNNAYRFINAVSDYSTHNIPTRQTATYDENLYQSSFIGSNPMIEKAMALLA